MLTTSHHKNLTMLRNGYMSFGIQTEHDSDRTGHHIRPQIGRDYPLNLSILLGGGKESCECGNEPSSSINCRDFFF
jgi:hypothetical protein